jgi:HSP90 family molecular chaperone
LAKLLRFPSTHNTSGLTSLEEYVKRMKDNQKAIYYIAGENIDSLAAHPTLEKLKKKGYEVFLLTDSVDEHCLQTLAEFQSHKISDTTRFTLKLDETEEDKKRQRAIETMYVPLITWYKKLLGAEVERVIVSKRLETSAGAVVAGDYGWTANMERIMASQVFSNMDSLGYLKAKKTFELNPNHPIVKGLLEKVKDYPKDDSEPSEEEKQTRDTAVLLYQTCLLNSGFPIPADSSTEFGNRLERLIRAGLEIPADATVSDVEVEIPETEVEEEQEEANEDNDEDVDFDKIVHEDL